MPDLCVQYNVGSMKMNEPLQDTLEPISIKGLHGRPIRATIIDRAKTDGGKKLSSKFGGRIIVVRAKPLIVKSPGVDGSGIDIPHHLTSYLTRLNALMDAWVSYLEGQLNSSFTLSYTPTGQGAVNRTVTYGIEGGEFEMEAEGENSMFDPVVSFSLFQETG